VGFVYFVLLVPLGKLSTNFKGKLSLKLALIMVLTGQQLTKSNLLWCRQAPCMCGLRGSTVSITCICYVRYIYLNTLTGCMCSEGMKSSVLGICLNLKEG